MLATFSVYLPELFKHEGGYVDHPRDPGGATNLGITIATLRLWRKNGATKHDVKNLTKAEAAQIYREMYWNKTGPSGADSIPAGPDAMLFDVAVNSGVGRAKQWYPLIIGKSAVDAVKAVGTRRRAFFQGLSTFKIFGRGWMRRVNEVEAWSLKWALKAQGMTTAPIIKHEADLSKVKAQRNTGGAVATGAGGGVAVAQPLDWMTFSIIAVPVILGIGYLIYNAVAEKSREKAMLGMLDQ